VSPLWCSPSSKRAINTSPKIDFVWRFLNTQGGPGLDRVSLHGRSGRSGHSAIGVIAEAVAVRVPAVMATRAGLSASSGTILRSPRF
jgi:hypothetical protein